MNTATYYTIQHVRHVRDHILQLTFDDGYTATLDFAHFLQTNHGVLFDPLRLDPALFSQVTLQDGTLLFPTGLDLCPNMLRAWVEEETR